MPLHPVYAQVSALLAAVFILIAGNGLSNTLIPLSATAAAFPPLSIGLIGSAYFGKLPEPNQNVAPQIGALNWYDGSKYTVDQRLVSARIDHVLSDRHRLSGRQVRSADGTQRGPVAAPGPRLARP